MLRESVFHKEIRQVKLRVKEKIVTKGKKFQSFRKE